MSKATLRFPESSGAGAEAAHIVSLGLNSNVNSVSVLPLSSGVSVDDSTRVDPGPDAERLLFERRHRPDASGHDGLRHREHLSGIKHPQRTNSGNELRKQQGLTLGQSLRKKQSSEKSREMSRRKKWKSSPGIKPRKVQTAADN